MYTMDMAKTIHGESRSRKYKRPPSREYSVWASMIDRCENPKCRDYSRYGGRGIFIDPAIRTFTDFLLIMGRSNGLTLERIDNNGPYSPYNLRWATAKEQARNRRNNIMISFNGKRQPLSAWARSEEHTSEL